MKLKCSQLQFSYTSEKLIDISNFEMQASNSIQWIRGYSGAGKSTFLSLLAGLKKSQNGKVKWNDFEMNSATETERHQFRFQNISFVHQENIMINHWTVEQNLSLVSDDFDLLKECLEAFNFTKEILKKITQDLSGGERQRINLIQAILKKPKIALLDEPTSHLDNRNADIALNLIEKYFKQTLVIIVSHDNRLENRGFKQIDFESINL